MYIYRVTKTDSSTDTGKYEDKYDIEVLGERFYSSRAKAFEMLDRRVDRFINRRDYSIIDTQGDRSLENNFYKVTLMDSEESFNEYGFYSIVEYRIDKIEVL